MFFDGFRLEHIDVGQTRLRVRHGGDGSPVLLLHGHPRTHATWHRLAPLLAAAGHTVVCPDLPGYGGSGKPASRPDHRPHSKRAMAQACVRLMEALGHQRFAVVGHDRGGYVAFRAAMDHPERVTHLAALDVVPIGSALARCDARFAAAWWHWFFMGQPTPTPERVINADPQAWYAARPGNRRELMGEEAWRDWLRAISDPETVHAMCEDYRAGLTVDRTDDDADQRAGRRLACPVLAVWAEGDDLPGLYGDVAAVWREWSDDVRGVELPGGHHLAEEVPAELAAELLPFLAGARNVAPAGPPGS